MLKLREDGSPLPAGGVCISPWVDLACTGQTLETNANVDLTATKASLQRMASQYLHGVDPRTPLASPLYADLSGLPPLLIDRKSTRLNSSHANISYAVFCLKKKKNSKHQLY